MRKASLAALAFGAIALAGCDRGNQDQLTNTDVNAVVEEDLDQLSNEAAEVAAEAEVLETQANQLQQEAQSTENVSGPETPADENIAGM